MTNFYSHMSLFEYPRLAYTLFWWLLHSKFKLLFNSWNISHRLITEPICFLFLCGIPSLISSSFWFGRSNIVSEPESPSVHFACSSAPFLDNGEKFNWLNPDYIYQNKHMIVLQTVIYFAAGFLNKCALVQILTKSLCLKKKKTRISSLCYYSIK